MMHLVQAVYLLLSLWCSTTMGEAIGMVDCRDVITRSCTDFCLSSMGNHAKLDWNDGNFDDNCEQGPCDIAALADEALSAAAATSTPTTGSVEYAVFHSNHVGALTDFGQCGGYTCGGIYDCKHGQKDVDDQCYDYDSDHKVQACTSPTGLLISSNYMIYASNVVPDNSHSGRACEFSSFGGVTVTFTRDVSVMKSAADYLHCDDSMTEDMLAADVSYLASQMGHPSDVGMPMHAANDAPVRDVINGLVITTILLFVTSTWPGFTRRRRSCDLGE